MMKVFLGGSRRISRLNEHVKSRIDNMIQNGYTILVGDANGVDKAIQNYLFDRGYTRVFVYCMDNECRNNIGRWETRHIGVNKKKRGFDYYSAKDFEMAKIADYGFMIWDAKSKGTLVNVIQLLKEHKKVLLYFSPEKSFHTLTSIDHLRKLLSKCDIDHKELFDNSLKLSQKVAKDRSQGMLDLSCLSFTSANAAEVEPSRLS